MLCLLGPVLLVIEERIVPGASGQALPIALTAICFFAYSSLSVVLLHHLQRHHTPLLLSYYLGERLVRLVISLAAIVAYILAGRPDILLFAVNLMVYYLVSMVLTSAFQIQTEKRKK